MIDQAIDLGINFFDTADSYGCGDSERLLGKCIRKVRGEVILSSKAGYHFGPLQKIARWVKPLLKRIVKKSSKTQHSAVHFRNQALQQNFSPTYIKSAIEGSLRRLGTEYLDIFLLHSPPESVLKRGDVFEVLEALQKKGRAQVFRRVGCHKQRCYTLPSYSYSFYATSSRSSA